MIADRIVVWLGVIENLDPGLMEASLPPVLPPAVTAVPLLCMA